MLKSKLILPKRLIQVGLTFFFSMNFGASATSSTPAETKSWEAAITAVEAKSERLSKKAVELKASPLGTVFNELDVQEHRCAILGRMLGKRAAITHLEQPISETQSDGNSYAMAAHSLNNWVVNARNLLTLSTEERQTIWNLDCAGKLRIPVSASIADDKDTFYRVDTTGESITILGPINEGFSKKLFAALRDNPKAKTIALGSGGGYVGEALIAGIEIRRRRLNTTLYANCYSACPLVFLAGIERTIWSPYPVLGFHQIYIENGTPIPLDGQTYKLVMDYADKMGADGNALVKFMHSAAPERMRTPDPEKLCESKIATWVQRICFSSAYRR